MTDRDVNEAQVRAYLAALNAADADAVAACVSEDFVNEHTSSLGETVVGRAPYRARLEAFFKEFSELRYDIEELLVDGDQAAVAYRLSGQWRGPEGGSRRARAFSLRGMFRFRLQHGLITQRVDYWDSAEFSRQVEALE